MTDANQRFLFILLPLVAGIALALRPRRRGVGLGTTYVYGDKGKPGFRVEIQSREIDCFLDRWPGERFDGLEKVHADFDSNGDLVDLECNHIGGDCSRWDGAAFKALVDDMQCYAVGAVSADQTMTDGGGIIVDASGPGATAALSISAMEIRQNDLDIPLPFRLSRRGNFANPAALVFDRARGTFAAPVDNQAADMMGCIDFYGWVNNAQSAQPGAQIIGVVTSVAAAVLDGALDFYAGLNSVSTQVLRLDVGGTGGIPRGVLYGAGELVPSANSTGSLGIVGAVWNLVSATDVCVYGNLRMGGAAIGGGATQTVLLPVAGTVLPVPQVGQVYLGGATFTGDTGQGDAALAISSEELAIAIGQVAATHLIPVMFNGHAYYLLAADDEVA
jgi:hypothetical protein